MENPSLQLSRPIRHGSRPPKWEERFILKRIDEEDIELSLREQQAIVQALARGDRFVQIRKHTVMLNAIKGIDPKWGEANIPPRPAPNITYLPSSDKPNTQVGTILNKDEIDEWDRTFKKEVELLALYG